MLPTDTLSLHDALPILTGLLVGVGYLVVGQLGQFADELPSYRSNIREKVADLRELTRGGTIERVQTTIRDISEDVESDVAEDRKSTRLNSSHVKISYAV